MTRLGRRQIEALSDLGPLHAPVVADRTHLRFVELGLAETYKGGCVCLTPAGHRALADLIEAGRATPLLQRYIRRFEKERQNAEERAPR